MLTLLMRRVASQLRLATRQSKVRRRILAGAGRKGGRPRGVDPRIGESEKNRAIETGARSDNPHARAAPPAKQRPPPRAAKGQQGARRVGEPGQFATFETSTARAGGFSKPARRD